MSRKNETDDLFTEESEDGTDMLRAEDSIEQVLGQGDTEVYTTPSDPDIKTLLGRIEDGTLILHPKFQRAAVWDDKRKSRLIESLLLNLPIPPCFLAEDDDGTRVVVDGQQRLNAINEFYHGKYALKGLEVLKELNEKRWEELPPKLDRKILQRVIRTLIISHHTHPDLRFIIFERLNTGAVPLVDQEIRNATLGGSFNDLINEIANDTQFLNTMRVAKPDERLKHHELILRFFAIDKNLSNYKPPLKILLTKYMQEVRKSSPQEITILKEKFMSALNRSLEVFGPNAFRKYSIDTGSYQSPVSRALFDLQMISLGDIPYAIVAENKDAIETAFKELSTDTQFAESLARATDHRSRFYYRQRKWIDALVRLGLNPPAATRLPPED